MNGWASFSSFNALVIIRMRPNPKPEVPFRDSHGQCPIRNTNANRAESFYDFKIQGRMMAIFFEELKILVGQKTDAFGKFSVALPKIRGSEMVQSSLTLPSL